MLPFICSYRQCLYLHQIEVWGVSPFSDTMMGYVHPVTTALCSEQTVRDITPSSKSSIANWTACRGHIFVSVHFSLLPFLTTLAVSTSWPVTRGVLGVWEDLGRNKKHVLLHFCGNLSEDEAHLSESGSSVSQFLIFKRQLSYKWERSTQLPQVSFDSVK